MVLHFEDWNYMLFFFFYEALCVLVPLVTLCLCPIYMIYFVVICGDNKATERVLCLLLKLSFLLSQLCICVRACEL